MKTEITKNNNNYYTFELKIRKKFSGIGYRITARHNGTIYFNLETVKRPSYNAVAAVFKVLWDERKIVLKWADISPKLKIDIQKYALEFLYRNTKLKHVQDDILQNVYSMYINIESNKCREEREYLEERAAEERRMLKEKYDAEIENKRNYEKLVDAFCTAFNLLTSSDSESCIDNNQSWGREILRQLRIEHFTYCESSKTTIEQIKNWLETVGYLKGITNPLEVYSWIK